MNFLPTSKVNFIKLYLSLILEKIQFAVAFVYIYLLYFNDVYNYLQTLYISRIPYIPYLFIIILLYLSLNGQTLQLYLFPLYSSLLYLLLD